MKKSTALSITVLILLLALTGCSTGNNIKVDSQYGEGADQSNMEAEEVEENTSEIRWAAVPAVYVNDTYFRIFADELHSSHSVPNIDDSWTSLGKIQSAVPGWESPKLNFQTNNEAMIGSEIYHSSQGHIPIINSVWGDPLNDEIIGDSVIVVFNDRRMLYITEEAQVEAFEIMDKVVRHSLMVDGVMYSCMLYSSGEDFSLSDNHVFLGEVMSAVPLDEYPTKNLQVNRENMVGAKIYRQPPGERSEIIVFFNTDEIYFYNHLPEFIESNKDQAAVSTQSQEKISFYREKPRYKVKAVPITVLG